MRLKITLNMPSKSDNPVHQILCSHPCTTLKEFMEEFVDDGYIIVDEYYLKGDRTTNIRYGENQGKIAITYQVGVKVKELEDNIEFVD
jgi:hypothetical protein